MEVTRGTQRWAVHQGYDHARYQRLWRLKRRGGVPLLDTTGKHWGYIEQTGGYFKLYTTAGRRWK